MNNINQNTSQTALIQQTLKAQAAGAIQQDAVQITKLKEPTKVRDIQDPEEVKESNLDLLHSKDEVVVSPKNQKILQNDPQLTSPDDHPYKSHECEDNDHPKFIEQKPFAPDTGVFKSLKGFFQAIIQAFSKQPTIVEQDHLEQPQSQPTSYSGKESRGQGINNFLSGWLELLPETVTGLEKFLDVEASHRQDDYQLFLQRQMVKIVKEGRRAMGEQQLSMVDNNFNDAEAVAKRAIIGEALLGFTFYKISSKKKELDQPDDTHAREEEGAAQGLKKHQRERRIRKAKEYLKQVEKELEGALAEVANEDTYAILKKILELTSQINEVFPDEVLVSS